MYKVIIELNRNITDEELKKLTEIITNAFDNRGGCVKNTSTEKYHFLFEGDEKDYGCLDLGTIILKDEKLFWYNTVLWKWEDEDPSENCDIFEEFSKPVR